MTKSMTYWILPSNEESFKLNALLKESTLVDWIQHSNFEVGDIVFIYNSIPYHKITHVMVVVKVNLPSSEYINDRRFWVNVKESEERLRKNRFVRLRWLSSVPENSNLTMEDLRIRGIKGNIQSARRITDRNLLEYIISEM